jgi:hypothetical protein
MDRTAQNIFGRNVVVFGQVLFHVPDEGLHGLVDIRDFVPGISILEIGGSDGDPHFGNLVQKTPDQFARAEKAIQGFCQGMGRVLREQALVFF